MNTTEMMTEDEPRELHPQTTPAEADPATAALTAGLPPEDELEEKPEEKPEAEQGEEDEEGPIDEPEDPHAGRDLPLEEEETPPAAAPPAQEAASGEESIGIPAPVPAPKPGQVVIPFLPPSGGAAAAPEAASARAEYWRRVLTGSADTVPDDVRKRAGQHDAGLTDEQREYRLLSTINRSWAVDHLGVGREAVRTGWRALREQLARRFRVADDEQELFAALSMEAQDAPLRERAQALYEQHCHAALIDRDLPLPPFDDELACARDLALDAQSRGKALRERYLPLGREVAQALNVIAAMEEDAVPVFRMVFYMPEYVHALEKLAQMDESTRQIVYAVAQGEYQREHPRGDHLLYFRMRRAAARGAVGLGAGVGQALTHAAVASMDSLGRKLGGEWESALRGGAEGLDLRSRIMEETRQLLQEEIRPLRVKDEAGFAAQLLVDAAGATPSAIAACCGGAGFATLGLSGMGETVMAARMRAPEGSQWLQFLAGIVGGGIQASIYSGMSRVGGQLLSNSINRFARASGTGAGGYTLAGLGVLGAMGVEEGKLLFAGKAAQAAGLGTQEFAARLEKTASNIDWQEYGNNALDLELNLREAAMALPFILIASGRVALRHFRSRHAVLGDGHALQKWGIDEATKEAVMKEENIDRQGDMLREALRHSRRWSAPGFIPEAMRALRLLNTDYYQGFKDPRAVVDFLNLPSQGGLVPRPPLVEYSAQNPEHVRLLRERHGEGEKVNPRRQGLALQIWDEWVQKAHLVPERPEGGEAEGAHGGMLPTAARRRHYGLELLELDRLVPPRLRPGGFYAPQAEAESMAMLRDRVAEIHDLSYQMLLTSFPLDALSHSSRSLEHLRRDGEKARQSLLEAVGRSVLRRATGMPEAEALEELGQAISGYFMRRRYSSFPPGWMSRVPSPWTLKLDEKARATYAQELSELPAELRDACRVALGLRSCASALYELMPVVPDFRTSLARGLSPVQAYVHLLSRELGVDMAQARGVAEMIAPFEPRATDMRAYRLKNEAAFSRYSLLTGCELESARGDGVAHHLWRVRRPNGSYTHWHRRKSDAINDLVANSSFTFMPFSYDRLAPLRVLDSGKGYDLNAEGKAGPWHFTGYDQLCRVALRDTARFWVESAPYALSGFELGTLRPYVYLGGRKPQTEVLTRAGGAEAPGHMVVDTYTLSSPLRLAQARFRSYWWRELNVGQLSPEAAGEELVKLRVISPQEWERVQDIATPLLMPRRRDVPLKDTPPPDVHGMKLALTQHLTDFSMRYFLAHLEDMPLPPSAREWFRLAPLCPLEPEMPMPAVRISRTQDDALFTSLQNRVAARELREAAPSVAELRRVEREGLLQGSPLLAQFRNAVGLNRALNLEQAWCMEHSGSAAMMGASLPFWRLMEHPVEGWKLLDATEQEALSEHLEVVTRRELPPEVMEAEGRGEKLDYLQLGLLNLETMLREYPALHQYGPAGIEGQSLVCRLQPDEPMQGGDPLAEPEYEPLSLYSGGTMQPGYRMGEPEPLPDFLQEDSRVLPALHLLDRLRSFPGRRPFVSREGILWKGKLYGGELGLKPRGLEEGWRVEEPLHGLFAMLAGIDALRANMPPGEVPELFGCELPGTGETLDLAPLRNVTLYRNMSNPANLCRLMPGEPDAAQLSTRQPYLVQSIAGASMEGQELLSGAKNMQRSCVPLDKFRRPYRSRIGLESSHKAYRESSLSYTLNEALNLSAQEGTPQGIAGLRELLLRFAEDSGFSECLHGADPMTLTYGQVQVLRVARELLLCVCGSEPAAAWNRLVALGKSIREDEDAGRAALRALIGSAESLYSKGKAIFRESRAVKKRIRKPRKSVWSRGSVMQEKENLKEWVRSEEAVPRTRKTFTLSEINASVRPDGYSRGFFDD